MSCPTTAPDKHSLPLRERPCPTVSRCWSMRSIRRGTSCSSDELDLSGTGEYKKKYGAIETPIPGYARSRWSFIGRARSEAERVVRRARGMTLVPPVLVSDAAPE